MFRAYHSRTALRSITFAILAALLCAHAADAQGTAPTVAFSFNTPGRSINDINDDHLAVSGSGTVVSVKNNWITVADSIGTVLRSEHISQFFGVEQPPDVQCYDPRVLFDRRHNRFIVSFLRADVVDPQILSSLFICCSSTNSPLAPWHVYNLTQDVGPEDLDFPQFSINGHDLFLTLNLSPEIWQVDLADCYAGNPSPRLQKHTFRLDALSGYVVPTPVRMVEPDGDRAWFLVHYANMDEARTVVSLASIAGAVANGTTVDSVFTLSTDIPYREPQSAVQVPPIYFQTGPNWGPTSAYLHHGSIQFVLNNRYSETSVGILYGSLPLNGTYPRDSVIHCVEITPGSRVMAHGSIAYAGCTSPSGVNASVVAFNYVSPTELPSTGVVYIDTLGHASTSATCNRSLAPPSVAFFVRGDYTGCVEHPAHPGEVWVQGASTSADGTMLSWVSRVEAPCGTSGVEVANREAAGEQIRVAPDHGGYRLLYTLDIPTPGDYTITLHNGLGQLMRQEHLHFNAGTWSDALAIDDLPSGPYLFSLLHHGERLGTEKVLVAR
ncbi:MAG TPA: hypothetical protein VHI13_09665 [Candidatus Kapabacteria bacterium]|nr:hypothetical protein [Candidatus Kapabacteria bacterium]